MGGIDWGDAPTWIAGVFAAGAAYYARATLKSQQHQINEQRDFIAQQAENLSLERAMLQRDINDRRSAQARQVRLDVSAQGFELNDETGQPELADRWEVVVRNDSEGPLYEVSTSFGDRPASWINGPNTAGRRLRILARSLTATFESPVFDPMQLRSVRPVVQFKDDRGVWWQLSADEELQDIDAPGATIIPAPAPAPHVSPVVTSE
ncbi:hypothetical protein [Streptomyces sp. NPDC056192]|uniref:hypothetical protein n=1 Tax=Streptomyces sp. NPDC056192 TaxID=3345743 RepID=UPI0035D9A46A